MAPAVRFVNPTLSTAAWVCSAGRMDIFILLGGAKVRVSLSRERAHEHGGQSRPPGLAYPAVPRALFPALVEPDFKKTCIPSIYSRPLRHWG